MNMKRGDKQHCVPGHEGDVEDAPNGLPRKMHHSREGWEADFAAMTQANDDTLLDDAVPVNKWDESEWKW
jgi:hypothetical protein